MAKKKRVIQKLTIKRIARIKTPGRYADGGVKGLYLHWRSPTSASWVLRFERQIEELNAKGKPTRRERWDGLGPLADLSIEDARERATDLRRGFRAMIHRGEDPVEEKRRERADRQELRATARPVKILTFREAVRQYIEANETDWSHPKSRAQWETMVDKQAAKIAEKPVVSLTTEDILGVLTPMWKETRATARRVRGRIEKVLDKAWGRNFGAGGNPPMGWVNPAQWKLLKANLARTPKTHVKKHHASLPFLKVSAFMDELGKRNGSAERALEFAILTATRTNEVLGARWQEVDFDKKIWTIPAARMKGRRLHRVPLSAYAIALLKDLPQMKGNSHIFVGLGKNGNLANGAMAKVIAKMEASSSPILTETGHVTPHGFRSAFRQWSRERQVAPEDVLEAALAHAEENNTVAAYVRDSDLLDARRPVMEMWATFCFTPAPIDNVVALRSAQG